MAFCKYDIAMSTTVMTMMLHVKPNRGSVAERERSPLSSASTPHVQPSLPSWSRSRDGDL